MDKILKISAIVTLCLGIIFLVMKSFVEWGAIASLIPFALLSITLSIMEFKNLILLENQIDEEYPLFLAEEYKKGKITKESVESLDQSYKNLHKKAYRIEKIKIIGLGLTLVFLAVGMITSFILLV